MKLLYIFYAFITLSVTMEREIVRNWATEGTHDWFCERKMKLII